MAIAAVESLAGTWLWWAGGVLIGLLVPILYYLFNVGLAVSTGYASRIRAMLPNTRLRWMTSAAFSDRWSWRLFSLGGIVCAGRSLLATWQVPHHYRPTWVPLPQTWLGLSRWCPCSSSWVGS